MVHTLQGWNQEPRNGRASLLLPTSYLQGWNQEPRNGRASWDQHVTLMAVRGVEGAGGHKLGEGGVNVIDPDGTNRWREGSGSRQSYVAMDGDEAW